MTPSQRKYLLMLRDEINRRLDEEPGYFERARQMCKQIKLFNGVVTKVVDVPDDECVGIEFQFQKTSTPHKFWMFPEFKTRCDVRAVRFSGSTMILSIHFNV